MEKNPSRILMHAALLTFALWTPAQAVEPGSPGSRAADTHRSRALTKICTLSRMAFEQLYTAADTVAPYCADDKRKALQLASVYPLGAIRYEVSRLRHEMAQGEYRKLKDQTEAIYKLLNTVQPVENTEKVADKAAKMFEYLYELAWNPEDVGER